MKRGPAPLPDRPPAFTYQAARRGLLQRRADPQLYCDRVPLSELAARHGTPLYVYSSSAIRERCHIFQRAFRGMDHTVCYSVKANSNLSILRLLSAMGCGFDVVSGGELERVLRADRRAARKIVFSGVGKTREELRAALQAGILLFNIESPSELAALAEAAAQTRTTARLALRVNPDVPAKTHPYISTGLREHKFGIPIEDARELYAVASSTRYLKVAGVSVHIGSQILDAVPFEATMERVAALVRDLRDDGHRIQYLDAGGGLGIDYESANAGPFDQQANAYGRAITTPLRKLKVHLLLEPGRSIVGPAGVLLTRILYRKTNHGKKFLVVDAAMTDLLRPALYGAYHAIVPVAPPSGVQPDEIVDVVGPVCETGDFLARDRSLPPVQQDDLLAVLDVGAYGSVLSSNYNTRPRAAEILVDGKKSTLIRKRESIADLLRAEL